MIEFGKYIINDYWIVEEFYENSYFSHKYINHPLYDYDPNLSIWKPSVYISHRYDEVEFAKGLECFSSAYQNMYGKYTFNSLDDAKAQVDEFFIKFSKLKVFL